MLPAVLLPSVDTNTSPSLSVAVQVLLLLVYGTRT